MCVCVLDGGQFLGTVEERCGEQQEGRECVCVCDIGVEKASSM